MILVKSIAILLISRLKVLLSWANTGDNLFINPDEKLVTADWTVVLSFLHCNTKQKLLVRHLQFTITKYEAMTQTLYLRNRTVKHFISLNAYYFFSPWMLNLRI
jgi:hypothetical protein